MDISELIKQISLGNVPITIYRREIYEGINCFVRITKNNKVFLDYDSECDNHSIENGFRATFVYGSFEQMICSVEKFTKLKMSDLLYMSIDSDIINSEIDWQNFKKDLYYHKVPLLAEYDEMIIGDIYWRGLYNQEISPDATIEEIVKWFKGFSNNSEMSSNETT